MKAISLRQPWADLVIDGKKTLELRPWKTNYVGPILIHGSKRFFPSDFEHFKMKPAKSTFGGILGMANLLGYLTFKDSEDCMKFSEKHLAGPEYFTDQEYRDGRAHGLLISKPYRFPKAIPYRGMLSLFEVPDSVLTENVKSVFSA